MLMTLISACHNLSRSVGCALLAAWGGELMVLSVVGGEITLFLVWKILRKDFLYWVPIEGPLSVLVSLVERVLVKVVTDFSGCLQFR